MPALFVLLETSTRMSRRCSTTDWVRSITQSFVHSMWVPNLGLVKSLRP